MRKPHARAFYETEAIHGGWSLRQLDRQITTQFFERTAGSSAPEALLTRHRKPEPQEALTADEAIRDPYLLEFLNDPVGIILCSEKDAAIVKYATGGIRAQVFASKYHRQFYQG